MPIDVFEKGAGAIAVYLLQALALTLVIYGAFPLLYAWLSGDRFVEGRYKRYCYIVNFVICLGINFINYAPGQGGVAFNLVPYLLWTSIFISLGFKIAYRNQTSKESIIVDTKKNAPSSARTVCKKCGTALPQGQTRCSICGTDNFG